MGKDTVSDACSVLLDAEYKVLLYVDSSGCSSCRLKLSQWETLMSESDSLFHGNLSFLFFFQPKSRKELSILFRNEKFKHPVFIDMKNAVNRLNRFPFFDGLDLYLQSSESNLHSKKRRLHSSESNLHSKKRRLHSSESNLHSKKRRLHSSESNLHSKKHRLHSSESNLHSKKRRLHSSESNLHSKKLPFYKHLHETVPVTATVWLSVFSVCWQIGRKDTPCPSGKHIPACYNENSAENDTFSAIFPAKQLTNISVCKFYAFYRSPFYCYLAVVSLRAAMWVKLNLTTSIAKIVYYYFTEVSHLLQIL
jgi:hypothetical protein